MCSDAALVEITRPSDHYLLTYDNKRDKIHNMIIKHTAKLDSVCSQNQPRTSDILDNIASSLPHDVTNKLVWMEGLQLEKYFICNRKIALKPSICKFGIYKDIKNGTHQ